MTAALVMDDDTSCDYCGRPGCRWQDHPEARVDVAAWRREVHRETFPFGDYAHANEVQR